MIEGIVCLLAGSAIITGLLTFATGVICWIFQYICYPIMEFIMHLFGM